MDDSNFREHPMLTRRRKSRSMRDQDVILRQRRLRAYRSRTERESATEDSSADMALIKQRYQSINQRRQSSEERSLESNEKSFEEQQPTLASSCGAADAKEDSRKAEENSAREQRRMERKEKRRLARIEYLNDSKQASDESTGKQEQESNGNSTPEYEIRDLTTDKEGKETLEDKSLENNQDKHSNETSNHSSDEQMQENSLTDNNKNESTEFEDETPSVRVESPKVYAQSAKDLVKSQERLLSMLQQMKMDISRMDREASRLQEDVVRSNQLFNVVVRMQGAHQLPLSPEGYNMSFSIPRVTYPQAVRGRPTTSYFLNNNLAGFHSSSRRSSCSSMSSFGGQDQYTSSALTQRAVSRSYGYTPRRDSPCYSGTESDMESFTTRSQTANRHAPSFDSDSGENVSISGDSSTESANQCARNSSRRPSYFFAGPIMSPEPEHSSVEL